MSTQLSKEIIQSLCGKVSIDKGQAYYRAQKVAFTTFDAENHMYEATVKANNTFQIHVQIRQDGDVHAKCTCPTLASYDRYCQHIAAVLLNILDTERNGSIPPESVALSDTPVGRKAGNTQLMNDMLGLFGDKPLRVNRSQSLFDTRTLLDVSFILRPISYGHGKYMFGIEMKVGAKQLYSIQNIRAFLERIDRGEACLLAKNFTYEPGIHRFQSKDDFVIRELIQVYQNEKMYSETSNMHSADTNSLMDGRMLFIPPLSWEKLLSLLTEAPLLQIQQNASTFRGTQVFQESIPLHFKFDQAEFDGYRLDIQGLDGMTVMESYGVVLFEGKLLQLHPEQCQRLFELKKMVGNARKHQIDIPSEHIESFIGKVLPGLMKLGSVHIAHAVSDRILQTQLKAKLFLDRVKDRLVAALEFQYGDMVINPMSGQGQGLDTDRILIRDGDSERRILELMEYSSFAKTESGYFTDDEETQYDFLYHVVPQLEKLVEVYATSAVKERLHTGHAGPKVRVSVDGRTEWLEFRFDMQGIPDSDIRQLMKSLEERRKYYKLPNGALLPLESAEFQEIIRLMNEVGLETKDIKGRALRLPLVRGLPLIHAHEHGNAVKFAKPLRNLMEDMRNPDNLEFPVPDSLGPILRDYQKYGFQWLKTLAQYRFGGILADEMGLGKTLQSIAFIVSVLPEMRTRSRPSLVVCPSSLVYNWRNEMAKFAPEIRAVIADGSKQERGRVLKDVYNVDVIITSYPLLRRDIEWYAIQSFHTFFLDEAQTFKNHTTQTAQAVRKIQAANRFALTGTPVENTLQELWSIFSVVFPQLFPSRKAFNDLPRDIVAKQIRPFLLRRLKGDVLEELPDKIESLQASELLPDQKKLYVAYLAKLKQETVKHLNKDGFRKNRIKILSGLTRLRQICCHPALFVEGYTGSSAKFDQLLDILSECRRAGKRVLVFSQFTEMLGIIRRELGYQGVPYFYLDGKTPAAERVALCHRFNEGEQSLFLISLKAGGTGLNLTGADTVILYDLWWNPAVEQQAADRAHRIGQKNIVQVIRLVAHGTVEDKMFELQQKKKNLVEEVIQAGEEASPTLTEQDIREILMI